MFGEEITGAEENPATRREGICQRGFSIADDRGGIDDNGIFGATGPGLSLQNLVGYAGEYGGIVNDGGAGQGQIHAWMCDENPTPVLHDFASREGAKIGQNPSRFRAFA